MILLLSLAISLARLEFTAEESTGSVHVCHSDLTAATETGA